ncbi:2'-5' RNA ligase family protein [Luteibacter sp.]|uniref:2'-5' RNA ligase family protein n=1 Tax=Luteibacter sp. TaxID=1886636 RepID=UPI002F3EE8D5
MTQHDLFGDAPGPAANAPHVRGPWAQSRCDLFFALRPSIDEARRIHAFAVELLASHDVSGNVFAPERMHITLEPIGADVDDAVVDTACRAADTVSFSTLDVRFDAVMSFSGPLVLLGSDGTDEVRKLRTELGCALADRGFRPRRAYEPHLTICYDAQRRVAKTPIEPIVFRVEAFALIKSHIGQSRHEVVRTWRLAG